jgi:mono/diheme cytochrome c family protein
MKMRIGLRARSCLVILCALSVPALARADAGGGRALAERWCAACHLIDAGSRGPVAQGPPSFQSIARSGQSEAQLRAFLTKPHGAMPDLALSRAEIDDLIAYIATQR